MAFCPNCGVQIADDSVFCPACGTAVNQASQPGAASQGAPVPPQGVPVPPPTPPMPPVAPQPYPVVPAANDHTADFDPEDISKNKVVAMAPYVMGILGLIIAFLAAPQSEYAAFHCRQALKLEIINSLLLIVALFLFWTFLIPIAAGVCMAIIAVVKIICFFQVCFGKAKDAPIVGSFPFLK